jgi:hypothetical protein
MIMLTHDAMPSLAARLDAAALALFWRWLASRVDDTPEFATLTPEQRARLAALLMTEASPWGPH